MGNSRREMKIKLLNDSLRNGGLSGRCEGSRFKPHNCTSVLHMNEVIYTRNHIRHLTMAQKRPFWHEFNCTINCDEFHEKFGHTHEFRDWFKDRILRLYGWDAVNAWNESLPLKVKWLMPPREEYE